MKIKTIFALLIFVSLFLSAATSRAEPGKVLRHVVMFKFAASATPVRIKQIEADFAQLPEKITTIKSFEWGINSSPEG